MCAPVPKPGAQGSTSRGAVRAVGAYSDAHRLRQLPASLSLFRRQDDTVTRSAPNAITQAEKAVTAAQARARIAVHEAAHAVAAVMLGGHVELARLDPEDRPDHRGLTTVSEDSLTADAQALVAHAGPWAEARFVSGRRPTPRELDRVIERSGHGDREAIIAAGGALALEVSRVEKVIEEQWPAVLTVAAQLVREGFATHWSVCNALGLQAGDAGGATSFGLSCVRAGMRPARRR